MELSRSSHRPKGLAKKMDAMEGGGRWAQTQLQTKMLHKVITTYSKSGKRRLLRVDVYGGGAAFPKSRKSRIARTGAQQQRGGGVENRGRAQQQRVGIASAPRYKGVP
eukprot:gene11722-biopygen3286